MYEQTISALNDFKTMKEHILSLGKILNKTEDINLKHFLAATIKDLQQEHQKIPKARTTPISLMLVPQKPYCLTQLEQYCSQRIIAKKPEWQVLAERHGWAPKE